MESGLMSKENYGDLKKNGWQRCSRTDKGVHAAYNGVNLKINIMDTFISLTPQEIEEEKKKEDRKHLKDKIRRDDIIKLLNNFLTDDIRCYGRKKKSNRIGFRLVTKKFDIKMSAFSRKYEYICPLKMFYKYEKSTYQACGGDDEKLNEEILQKLKKMIVKFLGTHNYHNFTRKGNPKEKTNMRVIKAMEVERVSKEELLQIWGKPTKSQYVRFKLHGQSFIYHQIRKMIGSMIQIFQEDNDEVFIDNAFTYNKTPVWLAPSQGLLLDRVRFVLIIRLCLTRTTRRLILRRHWRPLLKRSKPSRNSSTRCYTRWFFRQKRNTEYTRSG